jgi:site-specific recombinase XerD
VNTLSIYRDPLQPSQLPPTWNWCAAIAQIVGLLYQKGGEERRIVIHRQNYLDVKLWLEYQRDVKLLSDKTVKKHRGCIRHLLEWADEVPFPQTHKIRPAYPAYLRKVPLVKNYKPTGRMLSRKTQEMACSLARNFFTWARRALDKYRLVDQFWIETLRPARFVETVKERELDTLDEVIALTKPVQSDGLKEQRDKAAVALLFLSGMRVGAFTTLPAMALDLDSLSVKQWPELGVATKNGKAATTYLLNIPKLLDVVRSWDVVVRSGSSLAVMWYSRLKYNPAADKVTVDKTTVGNVRHSGLVANALKRLCRSVGISYRSPHKLRHGHAVYALKQARTIAELKAVSQNPMHSDLRITDKIYGVLTESDVQGLIAGLTRDNSTNRQSVVEMLELLEKARQDEGI